jgi:hypothetical protein
LEILSSDKSTNGKHTSIKYKYKYKYEAIIMATKFSNIDMNRVRQLQQLPKFAERKYIRQTSIINSTAWWKEQDAIEFANELTALFGIYHTTMKSATPFNSYRPNECWYVTNRFDPVVIANRMQYEQH